MNQQLKILLRTITTILVCLAMILAFMISGIRLLGFQIFGVLTGSMEPAYPTGSLIYVKEVDPSELKVRDVITFNMSGVTATHRIIEIVPDENNPSVLRYRTKGDANDEPDQGLVDQYNIIGKVVFSLPKMGYFTQAIQSPPGLYVAIGASILLIIFVFITDDMTSDKPGKAKARSKSKPARTSAKSFGGNKKKSAAAARTAKEAPARRSRGFVPGEEPAEQSVPARQQAPQQRQMQQQAYSQQQGYPQQQYAQQQRYTQQQAYSQQQRYPQQQYAQQQRYTQQQYAQQQGYPQQQYVQQQYAQQQRYTQQQGYPQQPYSQNPGYAQQGVRRRTAQPEYPTKETNES